MFGAVKRESRRPVFDSPTVQRSHELVREALERIAAGESKSNLPTSKEFLELIDILSNSPTYKEFSEVEQLCQKVETNLKNIKIGEGAINELTEACNELRLHVIAAALSQPDLLKDPNAVLQQDYHSTVCAIAHSMSGSIHGIVGDSRIILLPRATSERQTLAMCADFQELVDFTPPNTSWVLDFSIIDELHPPLGKTLGGVADALEQFGSTVYIAWISETHEKSTEFSALADRFGLHKIGNHYFSGKDAVESSN